MAPQTRILVLPGDGIGPEVTSAAVRVLEAAGVEAEFVERRVGAAAIEESGVPYPDGLVDEAREATAVLLGAVGFATFVDVERRPEEVLFALRKGLRLYANLRPIKLLPGLEEHTPLRPEIVRGTDLVVVRELTGGLYFGERGRTADGAYDTLSYSEREIERIVRRGFELARSRDGRLTSVDKANVLETSRLWREVVRRVGAEYEDVAVEHLYVDNAAMQLVARPTSFDVIVTENMFGDILSDEAAIFAGGLGMLPSASLGEEGGGLYEPAHGTAPDIAGTGKANPTATILSGALLVRHALGDEETAALIEKAVGAVFASGTRTADLGGEATTDSFTDAVIEAL